MCRPLYPATTSGPVVQEGNVLSGGWKTETDKHGQRILVDATGKKRGIVKPLSDATKVGMKRMQDAFATSEKAVQESRARREKIAIDRVAAAKARRDEIMFHHMGTV